MGSERRLAAILAADVEGYSRLMGIDESTTLETLHKCRKVIDDLITTHHGHFVGSAGDSVLAEFASAVDAVKCAYDIQRDLWVVNSELQQNRRMLFRIGVNLGDIIIDGSDIFGDGVNVAARLEGLAEGGGITVSRSVYNQVKNKTDYTFDDIGTHSVKNITEPVSVYRIRTSPDDIPHHRISPGHKTILTGVFLGVLGLLILEAAGIWVWQTHYVDPEALAAASMKRNPSLTTAQREWLQTKFASQALGAGHHVPAMRGLPLHGRRARWQFRDGIAGHRDGAPSHGNRGPPCMRSLFPNPSPRDSSKSRSANGTPASLRAGAVRIRRTAAGAGAIVP